MTYVTGDIPVGAYDSTRLANIGIGHGAIDFGGGYTYFNPQTGHEFSGVLGFTYNMTNPDTQYQSGIDMHFDWGMSQFLTKQLQIGLVGYAYQQLSCDSGSGDRVGCFESPVCSPSRRRRPRLLRQTDPSPSRRQRARVARNLQAGEQLDIARRAAGGFILRAGRPVGRRELLPLRRERDARGLFVLHARVEAFGCRLGSRPAAGRGVECRNSFGLRH